MDCLRKTQELLHNNDVRSFEMWIVLYTHEFGLDEKADAEFQQYIEPFDGVIMWTRYEWYYRSIPEKWEIFKKMPAGKRRIFGCYLYNFGEWKEATREAVIWQLNWYRERILAGEAEGVVMHTNTMADLDLPAYDNVLF